VRQLLEANNLNSADIAASGTNGRLTLRDVQKHLESRSAAISPQEPPSGNFSRLPHSSIRRRIAEHMLHSVTVAPQVTAVFEADFTAILQHRNAHRESFAAKDVNLTLSSYFIFASVQAMKEVPTVNSRWTEDYLEVYEDINFGIGTALEDGGLIVPVLKQAQLLSHEQIATQLHELTAMARSGDLKPSDVTGGTFSMSNHGVSGSLIAAPIIIIQPQSAILGIGKLEKRTVVRTENGADTVSIRPMAYVSLTIDHRVLDGQQTNRWLMRFVEVLETWKL
jgi:2-oxoglutarate dehydrogenase E2 component (dihydrolipoamide succinyltransferase)